jgi:hypothetical protein
MRIKGSAMYVTQKQFDTIWPSGANIWRRRYALRCQNSPENRIGPCQQNSFCTDACATNAAINRRYRIQCVDELLDGGLPLGAITEIAGPECSGRTSLSLSVLAGLTQASKVCAWIDVSDGLDPESAAAAGVELSRLLWVRCGFQMDPTATLSTCIHSP